MGAVWDLKGSNFDPLPFANWLVLLNVGGKILY